VSQKGAIDDTDSGFRGQFGLYPGRETAIFGDSVANTGNGDTAVSRLVELAATVSTRRAVRGVGLT